jgi:hypothetical protein
MIMRGTILVAMLLAGACCECPTPKQSPVLAVEVIVPSPGPRQTASTEKLDAAARIFAKLLADSRPTAGVNQMHFKAPIDTEAHTWILVTPLMTRTSDLLGAELREDDVFKLLGKAESVFEQPVMTAVDQSKLMGAIEYVPKGLVVEGGTLIIRPGDNLLIERLEDREVFALRRVP